MIFFSSELTRGIRTTLENFEPGAVDQQVANDPPEGVIDLTVSEDIIDLTTPEPQPSRKRIRTRLPSESFVPGPEPDRGTDMDAS